MLEQHLEQSRRHAADGERHLASQRIIVAELEASGRDAAIAKRLLATLEESQELHNEHIQRLLDWLETLP